MRTHPPHVLIRYRHFLLALAMVAWVVAAVVLLLFKKNNSIPVAAIVSAVGLIFVWANGAYWWVILRYPYIEVERGQFASREELSGNSHGLLLWGYLVAAILASLAGINVAVGG